MQDAKRAAEICRDAQAWLEGNQAVVVGADEAEQVLEEKLRQIQSRLEPGSYMGKPTKDIAEC